METRHDRTRSTRSPPERVLRRRIDAPRRTWALSGLATAMALSLAFWVAMATRGLPGDGPARAADRDVASADTLRALVRQLLDYQTELHQEEMRWEEQRDHLVLTRSLLTEERSDLEARAEEMESELAEAARVDQELTRRLEVASLALAGIDARAVEVGRRLLTFADRLPPPLRTPLAVAIRRLREALATEAQDGQRVDRLRLVLAFLADLGRVQRSAHSGHQVLAVGSGPRREVDVLYLGSVIGYWVTASGDEAGVLRPTEDGWIAERRSQGVARQIREAIGVYRKQREARIVELPIPAATVEEPTPAPTEEAPR